MVSRVAVLSAALLSGSCSKPGDVDPVGPAPGGPATAGKAGSSAESFSADLAKELGPGSAKGEGKAKDGTDPSGDGATKAGTGTPSAPTTTAGAAGATSGGTAGTTTSGGTAGTTTSGTGPGKASAGTTSGGTPTAPSAGVAVAPSERTAASSGGTMTPQESAKVPTDLAAIKISLLPNWDRDIGEAGTFQYVVRIKGTQNTKRFTFRYGYDDPKAPTDREQYKKYLQDSKLFVGDIKDRQRGGAWFLEGNDTSGLPAFRYVVLYGGKHLICYGSLYKDAESNRLGDDRDQTVIQAKQICETLAL
ncbi:MAG TPA: hypothetical protein VFD36_02230 [Kofleriaceae bacterium]|nr:hypothetical protein [Kofleriaceae bacterium]